MALAKEITKNYSERERLITLILEELQTKKKERAFKDAFMEASIKLEEEEEALTEIKKGEFLKEVLENLQYFVSHSLEYNDNIYGFEEKKSDMINRIHPEVRLKLSDKNADINFALGLSINLYAKRSEHNNQDINFDFGLRRKLGRYSLGIENEVIKNYIAPRQLGVNQETFPTYWMERFLITFGRRFNRLSVGLGYGFRYYDYESGYSYERDRISNGWGINLDYRIAPKTYFFSQLKYALINYVYDSSRDSDYKEFNFGLRGLLSRKLTGTLGMGYRYQNYKSASDFKSATLSWDLDYNFSRFTHLHFGFERTTEESGYAEQVYCVRNSFGLGIFYRLAFEPRISIRLNTEVSYIEFPKMQETKREDEIWGIGWGISYQMRKWLEFGFNYSYQMRTSNVDYDSNNNVFTFTTTATF